MKGTLGKFRSVRDKTGHRRNKSSEPTSRSRPDSFRSIFKVDFTRPAQKEKEEEESEAAKIEEISKRLANLNYHDIPDEWIRFTLSSRYAAGDMDKALELVQLQDKAFKGIIQPYNPNVHMLGAENRGNVTCYLDALLFAMFSKVTAFECMLKNDLPDEPQRKLAALLRLWVNMLRSGKLIHTDITEHIQNALADCGWSDARELEQQDTSEAFAFITETLQLPLLALQVDLFHHGKRDTDDHKVVHERLLNLAVPADPEGKGIKLEDCLEEYFNNKVEVLRDSPEEKKDRQNSSSSLRSTIRLVTSMEGDAGAERETEGSLLYQRLSSQDGLGLMESPITMTSSSSLSPDIVSGPELKRPSIRHRSTSLIQRIEVDDKGNVTDADPMVTNRLRRSGSTVVKAVTIPAWQFFRLIPWHATSDVQPKSDIDVARQFNQRPVVGICLKRYTMTEQGFPQRHNTLIDIPDSLRLPHFMMASDQADAEPSELSLEYKLVLQGVVCHRGDSLHSGHYISFSRVAPKLLTDNRRHDNDPPPDYEEAQWAKFDDLAIEERVSYVDDIKQALKEEMPYLLFYQIVPMVDVTATSTDGSVTEPPSYDESALSASATLPQTPQLEGGADRPGVMSRSASGYFDSAPTLAQSSGGPSIRFSSDLERPVRLSFDEDPYGTYLKVNLNSASRDNAIVPDVGSPTPSAHSEAVSPATVWQDDTATARLSRAAARFTKSGSRSRPSSQAGEGRISLTMTRLGLTKSSKEPLRDAGANASGVNVSVTSVEGIDEPYVVVDEVESKERDGEKDHHFLKHHHHRGKSKNRGDRDRGKSKEGKTDGVPDRECSIM